MIGKFFLVLFILFKIYTWISKANAKNAEKTTSNKSKPKKSMEDILGDFMKQIEQKAESLVKPESLNTDSHKAESDTHKKLDWQKVGTSKFAEKKLSFKHSNYKNISNSNNAIDVIDIYDEAATVIEIEEIDLKQAVIYKELLDRKYFTI